MQFPPVVAAPMAGGPSTPDLVNAVSFGFLALGTCSADSAREQLGAVAGAYGVNLFYPQDEPDPAAVRRTAERLGARVPQADVTSGFAEKFEIVLEAAPTVVSSTFGCFTTDEIARLHERGSEAWVTVTSLDEARRAAQRGVDGVIAQGPLAGGHRGTWDQRDDPDSRPLEDLLVHITRAVDVPVIAAGGVRNADTTAALLDLGAVAIACGSAFLLADEAGTSKPNRALLRAGGRSVSTRAFSGRWARGVESEFTRSHTDIPPIYPYLKPMVADNPYCLVGANFAGLIEGPAAEIEATLTP
ncbi:nitronate monooxygenase [Corynebacterium sp.]|uniref:nitronate monooxygenase n=1 Tax=Corynebacterium sp. TaxID=1720 RepID=UPI002A91D58E|nr:nitronate monooxygenase [Corynebacterium sp.]MDY5785518.1 nitronate monooxygenase [Corynebacterium sp.]